MSSTLEYSHPQRTRLHALAKVVLTSACCTAAFIVWVVLENFTGLVYSLDDRPRHVADALAFAAQSTGVGLAVTAVVWSLRSGRCRVAALAALLGALGPLYLELCLFWHPPR
jgi:hypothetical protein